MSQVSATADVVITDVVLLERKQLTCRTTWQTDGLVGQLRAMLNLNQLAPLYDPKLEKVRQC